MADDVTSAHGVRVSKMAKTLVAVTGLEPVRCYPADFKSAASTNSATPPGAYPL